MGFLHKECWLAKYSVMMESKVMWLSHWGGGNVSSHRTCFWRDLPGEAIWNGFASPRLKSVNFVVFENLRKISVVTCTKWLVTFSREKWVQERVHINVDYQPAVRRERDSSLHPPDLGVAHKYIKPIGRNALRNFQIIHLKILLFVIYIFCACHHRYTKNISSNLKYVNTSYRLLKVNLMEVGVSFDANEDGPSLQFGGWRTGFMCFDSEAEDSLA